LVERETKVQGNGHADMQPRPKSTDSTCPIV
jgi:hypothetical protein